MGHTYLEHGNGKHDLRSMEWGDFMLAPRPGERMQPRQSLMGRQRDRATSGGSRRNGSKEYELKDTGTSPIKPIGG